MSLPIVDNAQPAAVAPSHEPGPVERALSMLWQERAPAYYALRNVWGRVRVRRFFDDTLLRVEKVRVMIPTGRVPDCEACTELCCTGPHAQVSLRLRDIAMLVDRGRDDVISFDRTLPATPKKATWARREADGSVFHRAFPLLARDATGTCVCLTDDRQCGLFPSWPLSCARYPYALDLKNRVVFYAAGCTSSRIAPVEEAPIAVRRLVRAVVDAYNERVKDIVLLACARDELARLGVLRFVRLDELPW